MPRNGKRYRDAAKGFDRLTPYPSGQALELIKTYGADRVVWGTDCLWWGSPQWVIDAMKRFQISDEFCEKFGYEKITREDKQKIFANNAAQIYGIDLDAQMKTLPRDMIAQARDAYIRAGGTRENKAYGWVKA